MQRSALRFVQGSRCSALEGRVQWESMDLDDDGELMLRYARGDLRAFETLYERHRGGLYRYLARQTRNPEAANDLFQEVWSKVIASRERYEPRAKFQTFLYRIAHNCFVDYYRRSSARPEISGDAQEDWHDTLTAPESDRPDFARGAGSDGRAVWAKGAGGLADRAARRVSVVARSQGLSLEEIAVITAVGPETAKSRLRYAVAKLRHAMAPAGAPPHVAAPVIPTPLVVIPAGVVADAIQEGGV